MPKPTAKPIQAPAPIVVPKPAPMPKMVLPKTHTVIPTTGGSIGAKGTVNFNPIPTDVQDVCISTNCNTPSEKPKVMPNPKNKHDPRFQAPKPIDYKGA